MKKAIVILFVSALAAVTLAFAGCGDGGSSDTPEQVVEKFLTAAMAGDADAAYDLISDDSKAEVGEKANLVEGFSASVAGYEVGAATIAGDKASVPVSYQFQGMEGSLAFDTILVKEGGGWKISLSETNAEAEKALEQLYQELDTGE